VHAAGEPHQEALSVLSLKGGTEHFAMVIRQTTMSLSLWLFVILLLVILGTTARVRYQEKTLKSYRSAAESITSEWSENSKEALLLAQDEKDEGRRARLLRIATSKPTAAFPKPGVLSRYLRENGSL